MYVDDGISGAEFKNRPALLRMLNALGEFDVIVTSELSHLGREQSQTAIARTLNGDPRHADKAKEHLAGVLPSPPRKRTGSWAPSSVRGMLLNPHYTGKIPFGKHRKTHRGGTKSRIKQDEYELIDAPHLRIVPGYGTRRKPDTRLPRRSTSELPAASCGTARRWAEIRSTS